MKATAAMEMAAGGSRRTAKDLLARRKENGAGGMYHSGGRGTDESAYKSAEWSGE